MRGFALPGINAEVRTALESKMTAFGGWDAEFTEVFGDDAITYGRIADAIGEYERSQVFVNSPWKAFVNGDKNAISEFAKRGAIKFFSSIDKGGANCASCHPGDFLPMKSFMCWRRRRLDVVKAMITVPWAMMTLAVPE